MNHLLNCFIILAIYVIFCCGCVSQIDNTSTINEIDNIQEKTEQKNILENQSLKRSGPLNLSCVEGTSRFLSQTSDVYLPMNLEVTSNVMNNCNENIKGYKLFLGFSGPILYDYCHNGHCYDEILRNSEPIITEFPIGNLELGDVKEITQVVFVEFPKDLELELIEKNREYHHFNKDEPGHLENIRFETFSMSIINQTSLN